MTSGQISIEVALKEASKLQQLLKSHAVEQVRSAENRQFIKATAHAWFNNHRKALIAHVGEDRLRETDALYRTLLTYGDRTTLRSRYLKLLKEVCKSLSALSADYAIPLARDVSSTTATAASAGIPPQFSPLISDPQMQAILQRRWQECVTCVGSGAPLAATVMMGGLVEGLLLAKINQLGDLKPVFTAKSAPRDKSSKALQLKDWTLKNFIEVAHELQWITTTVRDIGEVMRDYRNYIHPQKELSHGIRLTQADSEILWNIAKGITSQILKP